MARDKIRKWFVQLFGTMIKGGSIAAGSVWGVAGANGIGINWAEALSWKQGVSVFVSAAVIEGIRYLQKSPLPSYESMTEIINKPKTKQQQNDNQSEN